jgi:flavin reductase (DIM6/NTAB) family NADH-FMN oxidoreductase RutF
MKISIADIENLDQQYRRNFINSLAGFRQVAMVATRSLDGKSNLAIFNSLIQLGASPSLFGLISRPDSVPRDTLQNILDTKEYTINFVAVDQVEKAHQTSARYPKHVSEFDAVGFDEQTIAPFKVPFISNAVVKIAMKFEEKIDIKINGTLMIIGSIQYVEMADSMVKEDGFVDLAASEVLVSCGLDAYFSVNKLTRLSYAKPDKTLQKIEQ